MIVSPTNQKEWSTLAHFLLQHAGVQPSVDLKMIGWVTDDQVKVAVGLHAFIGKACQIHVAMEYGYSFSPKELLNAVFDFAFNKMERELLIGVVNSNDEEVMRYDIHLGFKELHRIKGMHDNDGDIVILGMRREDCRYLPKKKVNSVRKKVEA